MIDEKRVRKYCKEDISLIENYDKAISDETQTWCCHHRDEVKVLPSGIKVTRSIEDLKEIGRYYHCPANELIFLTREEHNILHSKGKKHSDEAKRKVSKANKGVTHTEFGRKFKEHFGITHKDNVKLYKKENQWYLNHNKTCRWEKEA